MSNYDALLVVSFGGPNGPDDVIPFLENVLRGRNVPRERMLEVAEHYQHFGGVSPINSQNLALIEALKAELAAQDQSIASGQAQLASTPMLFEYYGSGGVPGFRGNPLREAWHTFLGTLVTLVRVLLQALAILAPIALLLGLILLLWRASPARALRRWVGGKRERAE